jgi:hypothetical protein
MGSMGRRRIAWTRVSDTQNWKAASCIERGVEGIGSAPVSGAGREPTTALGVDEARICIADYGARAAEDAVQSSQQRQDGTLPDPALKYRTPQELCEDDSLSDERKRALLRQWEYDLRSIQVASEENMTTDAAGSVGQSAERLQDVRRCLRSLGDTVDDHSPTTKQGGGVVEN